MGWTQYTMHKPIKQWFKEQWEYENSDYEALDSSLVNFNTLYGAVRQKSTGDVFCAVFLVRWSKSYHYNFSYKDMTEHCGPGVYNCPKKIFNLLTPLNDENDPHGWAREWRKNVEEYHNNKKKINVGDYIVTSTPINFGYNMKYSIFKKIQHSDHPNKWFYKRKRNVYVAYYKDDNGKLIPNYGGPFHFNLNNYNYEIKKEILF